MRIRTHRRRALLSTLGSIALAASVALGLRTAWPSPRQTIRIDIAAASLEAPGTRLPGTSSPASGSVPAFNIHLDLPAALMRGRLERLELRLEAPPPKQALVLSAGVVSTDLGIRPSGESGQAFGPGAAFAWTATARHGSQTSATIVLRVRRAGDATSPAVERLLLARDVTFPVRSAFGLSAPEAGWTSVVLALAGAGMLLAAVLRHTE